MPVVINQGVRIHYESVGILLDSRGHGQSDKPHDPQAYDLALRAGDVLASMLVPCLLIVGELDPRLVHVQRCACDLPDATFHSLPACDHVASLVRSDLVMPRVQAFLSKLQSGRSARGPLHAL
jgi:pimeloyl-ACP methyl ester carboxylesterase